MTRVLALTTDGRLTWCTASNENMGKGRCNHTIHQLKTETNEEFFKRANNRLNYSKYLMDGNYRHEMEEKLHEYIPQYLIDRVSQDANGESWIIAYGYDDQPYCNNGGWGKTDPYPFVTSDGKTFVDMYVDENQICDVNDENFVTPFNRNRNIEIKNGLFVLDKNKRMYRVNYPDVDKYDHVFIKHIPSF